MITIRRLNFAWVLLIAIALGFGVAWLQMRVLGSWYLENEQLERHRAVLEARTISTWNYRILPNVLLEMMAPIIARFGIESPLIAAFVVLRYLQNAVLLVLVADYFRRLGFRPGTTSVGLSMLAWSMTNVILAADLQWSSYFDAISYVAAALLVLARVEFWIVPLTAIAAFNRETCALMPLMALLAGQWNVTGWSAEQLRRLPRRPIIICALSIAAFVVASWWLRRVVGSKGVVGVGSAAPGVELFLYNLQDPFFWGQTLVTTMAVPIIALIGWRVWPKIVRGMFWVIVPLWMLVHLGFSAASETRYLLVPMALVFIPGCLCMLSQELESVRGAASPS